MRARLPQEAKSWLQDSFVRKTPSSPKNTCSRLRARSLIAIIDNNSRQQHLLPKTSFLELPVWDSRCLSLSASQVEVYFMRVIWISPSAHFCKCLITVLYFGFILLFHHSRRRRPPGSTPIWMKKRRNYMENNQALCISDGNKE